MYMNIYEAIITILCLVYITIYIKKKWCKEGFNTNMNHYKNAKTYEEIYDEFYAYLYDDLFYQEGYYSGLCETILKYINHVYNNHLCIGIKHGGHVNQLLKKNMKTISISKSPAVIRRCQYNYKDNVYKQMDSYDTDMYLFDAHTFTHISLIDNELYYTSDLSTFLSNCSHWLILKGYLMIQYYHSTDDLKRGFSKIGERSELRYKNMYKSKFSSHDSQDTIVLHETINDHQKVRRNMHALNFYSPEFIKEIAKVYDLHEVESVPINKYESVLVLQKL